MPTDYTTKTTEELMDIMAQGFFSEPQASAFAELQARIIKSGDQDDEGTYLHRGGIRPKHGPTVA